MKVLTIGLGTAGSRIADTIASQAGNTKNRGVNAIAIDNDGFFLESLEYINPNAKFYFPVEELHNPDCLITALTIEEVSTKIRTFDTEDHDAILICAGLGGLLIDILPDIVKILRSTLVEPIFGLCTIPQASEDEAVLEKATHDLMRIKKILDGIILFDNEVWCGKVRNHLPLPEVPIEGKNGPNGRKESSEKRVLDPYYLVNREIAQRMNLLIHAGEIQDRAPEMVLDTNEILNTITKTGFISIGYATEDLKTDSLFSRFIQKDVSLIERQERATRIVNLAQTAVFRNNSVECDLTTAKKALVLLTGPEQELSMKGFMAVRTWLDSSIAGYELRSGDFPISVREGNQVAVLIILAGLRGIPRLQELNDRFLCQNKENSSAE